MIDLHMHTTASDGTDSPEELIKKVREAGVSIFSVTDHDIIEGAKEIEANVPKNITFIRGIEFSAITNVGKCHILGYGCDWNKRAFREILEESERKRLNILNKRIEFLNEGFGIELDKKELAILRMKNRGIKAHLADILVSMELAKDNYEAMLKYINPCKTETNRIDGSKVIKAILESGGVPVWAHPVGGTAEKEISIPQFEKQLDVLIDAGLMGLECYYSKYSMKQVNMLVDVANKYKLLISGGSDYHGKNKTVQIGELNADGVMVNKKMLTVMEFV